jgi:hypothetical protein
LDRGCGPGIVVPPPYFEEYPVDGVAVAVHADAAHRAQPGGFPDADGAKEGERMIAVSKECCGAGDGVGAHAGLP